MLFLCATLLDSELERKGWPMRFKKKVLSLAFFLMFLPLSVWASPWEIEIAPYVWAIGMNGRVQVANKTGHLDQSFSDILRELDFAGMLWVNVKKDRFGFYANTVYAILSDKVSQGAISVDLLSKYGIFGAGISYEVFRYCFAYGCSSPQAAIYIEPYAGLRYTLNDTTLSVAFHSDKARGVKNVHWTDPLIGLRFNYRMNQRLLAILSGDIGGTNGSTHYSYSWMAVLSYIPSALPRSNIYLGYRLLDQRYQTGSGRSFYDWNMKLSGPILGFGYSF